jgi:DNA-binding XRE family transcriptional regulator
MAVKRRSFAQARRTAGFTQESLAERLGVDRTTVARWESGEYSPQPWLRPRIAEALGLSLGACGDLLDEAGESGTTGHAAGVSTALVEAPDLPDDALLAEHEQVPEAEQEYDRLSQAAELAEVFAEAQALQALASLPQVPWKDGSTGRVHRARDRGGRGQGYGTGPGRGLGRAAGVRRILEWWDTDNS